MGGWKLEVIKMAVYLSFPVTLFHYFNQPELFEQWVTNVKRELYPPENKQYRQEMERVINEIQERQERQMLSTLRSIEEHK